MSSLSGSGALLSLNDNTSTRINNNKHRKSMKLKIKVNRVCSRSGGSTNLSITRRTLVAVGTLFVSCLVYLGIYLRMLDDIVLPIQRGGSEYNSVKMPQYLKNIRNTDDPFGKTLRKSQRQFSLGKVTQQTPSRRNGLIRRDVDKARKRINIQFTDSRDVVQLYLNTNTNAKRPRLHYQPRVVLLESWIATAAAASATNKQRIVLLMGNIHREKELNQSRPERPVFEHERPFIEQCSPMANWQTTFHPTCNSIHELDLVNDNNTTNSEVLSMAGSWRIAWKMQMISNQSHKSSSVVLKMLHLHQAYNKESFELNVVDSIAMERLSASPYVVDEYGFCGQSVVTEFAAGEARKTIKDPAVKSDERLEFARDLCRGLSHIHSMLETAREKHAANSKSTDTRTSAVFAHNDINIANIIVGGNGHLKYNDFNIGVMMRLNTTSNRPCGFPFKFASPLWRAPEEILNKTYLTEKVDIYALGNVLFQVLTKHQPWTWLELNGRPEIDEVIKKKLAGKLPYLPGKYTDNSTSGKALYYAIVAAFHSIPERRPTAHQLAMGFDQVLTWRKEKKKVTLEMLVAQFRGRGQ